MYIHIMYYIIYNSILYFNTLCNKYMLSIKQTKVVHNYILFT